MTVEADVEAAITAAVTHFVSLTDLDAELGQSLGQLRSPHRHASERQRTLAGVIAWSEARLDDDERATLAGLSVFAGSFRPDDAVAVLGSPRVAKTLRSLVDRSLVRIDRTGPGTRYALLQTVHDFASERLASSGQEPHLARRRALRFLEVAEQADRQLRTAEEANGLAQIEPAFADIRVAHRWARGHDPALAGRLSAAFHLYAYRGLVDEPLRWAELTIHLVSEDDPTRPVLLAMAATRAINRGDLEEARAIAQRAVALAGSGPAAMPALEALGDAGLYLGRLDESRAAAEELARRAEAVGDMHSHALRRVNAALAPRYGGQAIGPEAIADLPARLSDRVRPVEPGSRTRTASSPAIGRRTPPSLTTRRRSGWRARSTAASPRASRSYRRARSRLGRGTCPARWRSSPKSSTTGPNWPDNTHQLTALRNLAVLLQRAGAPKAAAELLGALERDDSTYGEEAERLEAVRSGHARSLVTKCSRRTSPPVGSAMSPSRPRGPRRARGPSALTWT